MEASPRWHRILLVDDDLTDLFISRRVIELCRVARTIQTTNRGATALRHLRNCAGLSDYPSLILLDAKMPGLSGFAFLEACQTNGYLPAGLTRVILLTSSINPFDRQRAAQCGVHFLEKPLTPEKLMACLVEEPEWE
ncbi:MAG: response regulator [Cytophagales bacterium]|nr:response regulator [Cytophagales bacterium]